MTTLQHQTLRELQGKISFYNKRLETLKTTETIDEFRLVKTSLMKLKDLEMKLIQEIMKHNTEFVPSPLLDERFQRKSCSDEELIS